MPQQTLWAPLTSPLLPDEPEVKQLLRFSFGLALGTISIKGFEPLLVSVKIEEGTVSFQKRHSMVTAFLDSALWCLEEIGKTYWPGGKKQLPAGRFEMGDESGTLNGKGQERRERGWRVGQLLLWKWSKAGVMKDSHHICCDYLEQVEISVKYLTDSLTGSPKLSTLQILSSRETNDPFHLQ